MPDALRQIWDVPVNGALVLHSAGDPLRHLHRAASAKIAVIRALLHGIDGAHPTVALQTRTTLRIEVLPRGLLGACNKLPHIAAPAPRARAFTMCPGLEIPPSARIG